MFSLTNNLIESVEINGNVYSVDMSFDNVLRLIDMLNDDLLMDALQVITGVQMLLDTQLDLPIEEQVTVFNELYKQLIGTNVQKEVLYDLKGNPMPVQLEDEENEQLYDFKEDAEYIYASFMQDYGIDLIEQQGKLHWYKFRALLGGLSEGTKFRKVLEIRQTPLPSGKGTSKQRAEMEKLKKAYALKNVKAVSD